MAFLVETGGGVDDANAYIDTDYFDDYHTDRGHTSAVALDDDVKKACIIRATDYVDKRFGRKFRGYRIHSTQGCEWPRLNAFDDSDFVLRDVPKNLKKAIAEYAFRAAIYSELAPDPLMPVPVQDTTGDDLPEIPTEQGPGAVAETDEKVDVIEEKVRFASPNQRLAALGGKSPTSGIVSAGNIPEYPAADMLLEQLLTIGRRTLERA